MANIIIVVVVIIALAFAVYASYKHIIGQGGGCCGSGSGKAQKKKLDGPVVAEKIISIEGMHCENCKNSVERQINKIDGAVAKVDLKKNIAVVSMDRMISDDELRAAVERAEFQVTDIRTKEG